LVVVTVAYFLGPSCIWTQKQSADY